MISEDEMTAMLETIILSSPADQTEALMFAGNAALTRFANNEIHQNFAEEGVNISLRSIIGGRSGFASTNDLVPASLSCLLERSLELAQISQADPAFVSLPGPLTTKGKAPYSINTVNLSPKDRADGVGQVLKVAKQEGLIASGAFLSQETKVAVANSLGVMSVSFATEARVTTVLTSENSSGYAEGCSFDVADLDLRALATLAAEKALRSRNPIKIAPGRYDVILEATAVADLLAHLAFSGFSALSFQEKRSFFNDKLGERVVGTNITIGDDALSDGTIGLPFDCEGIPKQRVVMIDKGIAKGLLYDSYTAQKEGLASTGHALPAPNPYGPQAQNLYLEGGNSSLVKMILESKKAILVTRFHYTNMEDPLRAILTGMTRDGTFLVENGVIGQGIKNLRFTQSILEALSSVTAISKETELKETFMGYARVPHIKIADFNFTGDTDF